MAPPREGPFFRPGASSARVAAGAMGGVVGGLLFGVLMLGHFIADADTGRTGMAQLIMQFLGTSSPTVVWAVHIATSLALGVVFGLIFAPTSFRSSLIAGVCYALMAGFIGSQLVLRTLLGYPVVFDAGAMFAFIGHLVYGAGLGLTYPWFHRMEMREALSAASPRVRAWGWREQNRMRRT
jgi:hypothetical protein